jgi:hypothetical protein
MKLFWSEQYASIQSTVAQQQLLTKHSVNVPLFAPVLKQVHGCTLVRSIEEFKKLPAKGPLPMWTCSIQQSIGLSCYHTLYQRKLSTGVIHLKDIYAHWYYSRPEPGTLSTPALPVVRSLLLALQTSTRHSRNWRLSHLNRTSRSSRSITTTTALL